MLFNRAPYDCTPSLKEGEHRSLQEIQVYLTTMPWWPPLYHPSVQALQRLLAPIEALLEQTQCPKERRSQVKRFLCQEMHQCRTTFWDWSSERWVEIIGTDSRQFGQRHPTTQLEVRLYLAAMGYLLNKLDEREACEGISPFLLATKVFGRARVETALHQVTTALHVLADPKARDRTVATALGHVLLANRSPLLTDLTIEIFEAVRQQKRESYLRRPLVALSRALAHLNMISHPLEHFPSGFSVKRKQEERYLSLKDLRDVSVSAAPKHHPLIDVTGYDRNPSLTEEERATLAQMYERFQQKVFQWRSEWRRSLERLLTPLDAVVNRYKTSLRNPGTVYIVFKEMHERQTSFWAWSVTEWRDILGQSQQQFCERHGQTNASRMMVAAVGYLLCDVNELDIVSSLHTHLFAQKVFGRQKIEAALKQVVGQMEEHLGYTPSHVAGIQNLLCLVLVYNRSPEISAITIEILMTFQRAPIRQYLKESILTLSQLLASLGVLPRSLPAYYPKDWGQNLFEAPSLPRQEEASHMADGGADRSRDSLPAFLSLTDTPSSPTPAGWRWPVDVTRYDRTSALTEEEQTELAVMMDRFSKDILSWRKASRETLQRLLHPLYDVFQVMGTRTRSYSRISHVLLWEMHQRQISFWGWSEADWLEVIGQHEGDFRQRHDTVGAEAHRQSLAAVGYLLCQFNALTRVDRIVPNPLACKVFGKTQVDDAVQTVHRILGSWGYTASRYNVIKNCLCAVLLSNRSPLLSDVTLSLLESLQTSSLQHYLKPDLVLLSLALVQLGILTTPLTRQPSMGQLAHEHSHELGGKAQSGEPGNLEGKPLGKKPEMIDEEWLSWCQRWRETSTLEPKTRQSIYYSLLQAGRWLMQTHPQVTTPSGWDRELAAEYVAAVCHMTVGQWSRPATIPVERIGKPLTPRGQDHLLSAMRAFFRDCQEWEWIPVTFHPGRSFATPRSVRGKIGPNPRVLADDVWAKLLAAGLSVTTQDFINPQVSPESRHRSLPAYPLEMLRALVVVWLFAGLRSDEICRLRVGCARFIQTHGNEEPSLETNPLPPTQICLLDIPVNKTSTAFTKPVDFVVGEAILAWEKVRPIQPALLDPKTGEMVHYLFAFRLTRLAKTYVNEVIIPALCRKAGIPESDARGKITSHRARSTIASQLANAKEPMSLFELQQWLGHKTAEATRSYVKSSPTKLAQAYADAEYFKRNLRTIEVLLDQDVIQSGAASRGEPWRFYDLGHGYCTYDFFDQCPHRMACAKCTFYQPKGSSQAQMLEAKANLIRMRQEIPLSDEEKAAVEDGLTALEKLCEKLLDVPTPAGPTPRELEAKRKRVLPMISFRNGKM